jgi:hypothetical protein
MIYRSGKGQKDGWTLTALRTPAATLLAALSLAPLLIGAPAAARAADADAFTARLRALVLLETLNADLLSHDSATETLQRWCDAHGPAPGVRIAARRVMGADKPADAAVRHDLGVGPAEPVAYRRVRLVCGDIVLSAADNWYLPARLTPEMNRLLDETDQPFGAVVRPLAFHRHTLSARLLFQPLPPGWETGPPPAGLGPMIVPPQVLEHRAVLSTAAGAPFSVVVETYTDAVLGVGR